jgi:uncharacterized UPF0160 family protein
VVGIKEKKNTIRKTFSTFGRTNYQKNLLRKNGLKNTKDQSIVITQKGSVKRLIVKVEKNITNEFDYIYNPLH